MASNAVKGFSLTEFLIDPTGIFTVFTLLTPPLICGDLGRAIGYFFTPALYFSFLFFATVVHGTHGDGQDVALSSRDRRVANWFLCNGVYFNLFLDVVSGQLQMFGEMSVQYLRIEPKYAFGLYRDAGQSVFMTSMCELFFQSPICLLIYFAYHRGKAYRRPLEILIAALHIAGVWWFYVPEILNSFPHAGGWPQSFSEAVSFERLLFFWTGYFIFPALWVLVPYQIAKTAWIEICDAISKQKKKE